MTHCDLCLKVQYFDPPESKETLLHYVPVLRFFVGRVLKPAHIFSIIFRCLAANELVGLLGMLVQMHIQMYFYKDMSEKVFCVFRVLWRVFGLGSGCIAIVMAVERWLALTHPFTYQQVRTRAVMANL